MGENEQGGMLRVVVVVGLIAMIVAVVIFAVTGLKNTSSAQRNNVVAKTELMASPDYGKNILAPAERNITFSAPNKPSDPNDWPYWYKFYRVGPLEPGQTYTFSAKVNLQNTDRKRVTASVYDWDTSNDSRYLTTDDFKADGSRDSWTFTVPKNINTEKAILIVYAGQSGNTGGITATYSDMKLEKGADATPFDFK